ncbi:MAG: phospholipase A [Gammaproteobacteria bacterium]|jgi:phospholipase A1|nr:phospholipase A [Gammaproteobacteria bacterium]
MPKPSSRTTTARPLWLAIALVASPPALARAPTTDLASCAAIRADVERLACYDRAAGRKVAKGASPGATASAGKAQPAAKGQPDAAAIPAATPEIASAAPVPAASAPASLIDAAWGFEPDSSRYLISLYRPNYFLLGRYSDRPNEAPFDLLFNALDKSDAELDPTEAEFQLSFKARLWASDDRRFGVWAAYTQRSQWQVYNSDLSAPFRETNYEPEVFVSYNPEVSIGGIDWRLFNFGYNHQSNGRSDPLSRSWDRLVAEFGIEHGDFALLIRPWVVIDEGGDDNPDITDYLGWGDVTAVYKWQGHSFTLMGRGNPDTGKGAVQFTWMSPPVLGPLRAYVEAFSGYGDSMIDYNWYQNTIGVGIALNDYLDRPGR